MQCSNKCVFYKGNYNTNDDKQLESHSSKTAGKSKTDTINTETLNELAMENRLSPDQILEFLQQSPMATYQPPKANCITNRNLTGSSSAMHVKVENVNNNQQVFGKLIGKMPPVASISGIYRRSALSLDEQLGPILQQEEQPSVDATNQDVEVGITPEFEHAELDNNDSIWLKGEHDALEKLAYNIWQLAREDHIVIDRNSNEVIRTNANTNQKTIYRLRDPFAMGMNTMTATEIYAKRKMGRPRKRVLSTEKTVLPPKKGKHKTSDDTKQLKATVITKDKALENKTTNVKGPLLRTRFGRVVRNVKPTQPPNQMVVPLDKQAALDKIVNTNSSVSSEIENFISDFVSTIKDEDYLPPSNPATKTVSEEPTEATKSQCSNEPTAKPTRFVPPQSVCPICKKVFLGRRLERHFVKFPDHMRHTQEPNLTQQTSTASTDNMTLFNFLISKLQRNAHLNEEQRADLFLTELNDFIEQLQVRSTRLIRNTSGLHFVNARTARVLSIPEGQYALDMTAIETEPDSVTMLYETTTQTLPLVPPRNLVDYTTALSMSIDDTLTDEAAQKLNLSAGGKLLPPSEESLLRTFDDFSHMQDAGNIAKLNAVELQLQPPVVGISNENRGVAVVVSVNADVGAINIANGSDETGVVIDPAGGVVASHINGNNVGNGNSNANVNVSGVMPNDAAVNGTSNNVGVGDLLSQYVHVSDNAVEAMNMKIEESTNTNMIVDFSSLRKTKKKQSFDNEII